MIPLVGFAVLSCLCALAQSFPLADSTAAVLIDYKTDSHSRFEEGQPGTAVRGSYSWVSGDKIYQVDYTADERGYKPRLTIKSAPKSEPETVVQQDDEVQLKPAPHGAADDIQSAKEVDADAIVIDVAVAADASVEKESAPVEAMSLTNEPAADQVEHDKVTVTHQLVANAPAASPPAAVQESGKAETVSETDESEFNKVADAGESDVRIPVVPQPIVQQEDSHDKSVIDVDEVKPDELIAAQEMVVNAPVQSDVDKDDSQSQPTSLDVPTEVKPDQLVAEEDTVVDIPVESMADVEESAQGDINPGVPVSQNDAQEMIMELDPSMVMSSVFDPQSGDNQSKDEIYTDDAVIIDAAIDPLILSSDVLNNIDQWDKVYSQDEASAYLNAMLMEYYQMYSNGRPQAEIEDQSQPEIREEIEFRPEPFYYEVESQADDSLFDYQLAAMDNSNDDAYSDSFDKLYNSFLRHLEVAKEYRPRSKVDDDMQDQEGASQDLQTAFRLLVDVAESFSQNLPIRAKEIANIEPPRRSVYYAPEDSVLEELYYQKWLASQQQQPIYYIVYPEADDYYRLNRWAAV